MQYSEEKTLITKENAYPIFKAFAKEYKKQNGNRIPAEIVIVGGGSILLNYGFRESTQDFDVLVQSMEPIKNVAYRIADQYNLSDSWMNTDFLYTASYSDKLREVSKHFCSFNNGNLEFRTVKDEFLIAMKMVSARKYRNDISDVVGILAYVKRDNADFSMNNIDNALDILYGDRTIIKEDIYNKVSMYMSLSVSELMEEYIVLTQEEHHTYERVKDIDEKYPDIVMEDSMEAIINSIRSRKGQ